MAEAMTTLSYTDIETMLTLLQFNHLSVNLRSFLARTF